MDSLRKAHALKEELDRVRPLSAEQERRVMDKFRLDWNFNSNNLEGNSLSYGETKALLLFGITAQGKPLKDHFEITGHNEAVLWVEDVVKSNRPLTETFIRELHAMILKEPYEVDAITPEGSPTIKRVNVGQYKRTPNHVKTVTGEIFRFATPEETPALMNDLMDWYNSEIQRGGVDPVLLATEFHYRFIRIHPFDDGNGRTVRILMNFILMRFGYPPVIIKSREKAQYLSALQQADSGMNEPFVEFIAANLVDSLSLMLRAANGEDIEEEDDIDKELRLLEQKLASKKRKITLVKSSEVLDQFFDSGFKNLLEKPIAQALGTFNRFFLTNRFIVRINGNVVSTPPRIESASPTLQKIVKENYKNLKFETVTIECLFSDLKFDGYPEAGIGFNFEFVFTKTFVTVSFPNYSYDLLYDEELPEVEARKLVRAIKLFGKEFIEGLGG